MILPNSPWLPLMTDEMITFLPEHWVNTNCEEDVEDRSIEMLPADGLDKGRACELLSFGSNNKTCGL